MRRRHLALVLALTLGAVGCGRHEPPNIIVLMVDTLRADYLEPYGFSGPVSPNIAALAGESVVYESCIAQSPWTKPSIASLFTSLYAQVHQITNHEGEFWSAVGEGLATGVLPPNARTLAEALQAAGYATGGFIANPWVQQSYGFAQGFDHYDESGTVDWVRADSLIDAASDWIETLPAGKPFFAYLHFMDVHAPYDAPQSDYEALVDAASLGDDQTLEEPQTPYRMYQNIEHRPPWATDAMRHQVRYWRARYASGVRAFDGRLGVLLEFLRDADLYEDAIIVLTADHGEELFEHAGWSHGLNLYEQQLHVPLILHLPGQRDAGRRVQPIVELIDVMPTLLALAGVEAPDGLQGRDLSRPDRLDPDAAAFATATQRAPGYYAVRTPRYKLHHNIDNQGSWLFDLTTDPGEQRDIATLEPERVAELQRRLGEHITTSLAGGTLSRQSAPLSDEMLKRLKSLGYVN